jgi:hypothetical protein
VWSVVHNDGAILTGQQLLTAAAHAVLASVRSGASARTQFFTPQMDHRAVANARRSDRDCARDDVAMPPRQARRSTFSLAIATALTCGACSTVEVAYDVPCRVGDARCALRLWVRPRLLFGGTYCFCFDLLLAPVDVIASGYLAIADLTAPRVRTRGGPVLAPVLKIAAVLLPCVSAYREHPSLQTALLGWDPLAEDERTPPSPAARGEALALPEHVTLGEAADAFARWYARHPAQLARIRDRIVEAEWVPGRGPRGAGRPDRGLRPFLR